MINFKIYDLETHYFVVLQPTLLWYKIFQAVIIFSCFNVNFLMNLIVTLILM